MLYQTPYPLLFQFHPLPKPSSTIPLATTPPLPPLPLFSPRPPPQAETEMECVETALKTSLRKDMTILKPSPQTLLVDIELSGLNNNAQNGASCDDFFVDDLLDFSHVEEGAEENNKSEQYKEEEEDSACVSLQKQSNQSHEICNLFKDDYASLPTSELNVPTDDVADLEWLSHFVEDSFSEFSAGFPVVKTENPKALVAKEPKPEQESPVFTFKTPVQTKARSKRTRTGVRVWPFGSPTFTESSSSSTTTTTTSSSSSSSPTSPLLIYTNLAQSLDQVCSAPAPAKKPKKTSSNGAVPGALAPAPRRCSHCGVQKTPQWRTGPLGAKTLCNACGVRFKSGRLLPEYRPACSPTFSSELHSNHHRKVLEMRRKKDVTGGVETGLAHSPVVPSF